MFNEFVFFPIVSSYYENREAPDKRQESLHLLYLRRLLQDRFLPL